MVFIVDYSVKHLAAGDAVISKPEMTRYKITDKQGTPQAALIFAHLEYSRQQSLLVNGPLNLDLYTF